MANMDKQIKFNAEKSSRKEKYPTAGCVIMSRFQIGIQISVLQYYMYLDSELWVETVISILFENVATLQFCTDEYCYMITLPFDF